MVRTTAAIVWLVIVAGTTARGAIEPTILVDRTGSMADQQKVEQALLDALVKYGARRGAIRLLPFGDHVLNVPAQIVTWEAASGWHSPLGPLSAVENAQLAVRAREALGPLLNAPAIVPAKLTNVPAALVRAGREAGGALVVFDAKNEVPTPFKPVTLARFPVVICAAQGDSGARELEIVTRREHQVRQWAPNAKIFGCSEIDEAVRDLLSARSQNGVKAVKQRF
jgi:hypothetical protein